MIVKQFTYKGFDGKSYTDEWCFHLSESDVFKINYGSLVGLDAMIKKLIDTRNGKEIMGLIDEIIMTSVGHRGADGRQFIKNEELRQEFRQTDAYSQLFMELAMDGEKASEFLMGVIPQDMAEKARANMAKEQAQDNVPAPEIVK